MDNAAFVAVHDVDCGPLDPVAAIAHVSDHANGAAVLFCGQVRNNHKGRTVDAITYDVFVPLCLSVITSICAEAGDRWGPSLRLHVTHAQGRVEVGQLAIVIAAGSPHRDQAFQASRYIIDEIKKRAPVWKLEHFSDGEAVWAEGYEVSP